MSGNYQSGHNTGVYFEVLGQGTVSSLCVSSHSLDISVLLFDVTGTCHGGNTARLAGKRDAAGTVNAFFDADSPPYLNPPYIREGVSGVMLFYFSSLALGRPMQVPVIIEKVHYETAVAGETKYSFDVKMNSLAGTFAMPAA